VITWGEIVLGAPPVWSPVARTTVVGSILTNLRTEV
jgi:hypothetical protein